MPTAKQKKKPASKAPVQQIDIAAMEAKLPPKQPRSHHIVIKVKNLHVTFGKKTGKTHALKDIDLNLYSGEFVIISGPSGSGKSTLLHVILGLEKPTKGHVEIRGENIYGHLSQDEIARLRRDKIGMLFQQSNWIKSLSVWENVAYPLWLIGRTKKESKEIALQKIEEVGLEDVAEKRPAELSGGQQQRLQLARALVTDPGIIIADEPTGNLDTQSATQIVELLVRLNREKSRAVIMVTHEISLMPLATRQIVIKDGAVIYDKHE